MNGTDAADLLMRHSFEEKLRKYEESCGTSNNILTATRILDILEQMSSMNDFSLEEKYEKYVVADKTCLIFKRNTILDPAILILPREEYFDTLNFIHESCNHGGCKKMIEIFRHKYYIPIKAVEIFIDVCPTCGPTNSVASSIKKLHSIEGFNIKGEVDIIDFQQCPDEDYRWLLKYQDHGTHFLSLRPLRTNEPKEIATELSKIFLTFGPPYILCSEVHEKEFIVKILKELKFQWPDCVAVGSIDNVHRTGQNLESNKSIVNRLQAWMRTNNSNKWSLGCYFIQFQKNASFNYTISQSPYRYVFCRDLTAGQDGTVFSSRILITGREFTPLRMRKEKKRESNTLIALKPTECTNTVNPFETTIDNHIIKSDVETTEREQFEKAQNPNEYISIKSTEFILPFENSESPQASHNEMNISENKPTFLYTPNEMDGYIDFQSDSNIQILAVEIESEEEIMSETKDCVVCYATCEDKMKKCHICKNNIHLSCGIRIMRKLTCFRCKEVQEKSDKEYYKKRVANKVTEIKSTKKVYSPANDAKGPREPGRDQGFLNTFINFVTDCS
ncbi:KRAB-A domain-containing protein 2-like [Ostrinia nubilalis]|uniref:KRAB-A domain-containing protein 2-like n=1 Tax=Ostrinia nubilalis TaxID=29057 RepID=UPI0030823C8E